MTQADCFKVLNKSPGKWFTSKEVANILKQGKGSISVNLKALYKKGEIQRRVRCIKSCYFHEFKIK
jgi:predicted transcriptional regulator